ncbi:hypothetical protein [Aeromicrobium sp. UC242_57]|uniref:hypothetical protein n=1 Tax=Aeromicrobium sp. UC242_57 TaxID=3374624 RepID=UPI0037AA756D
MVDDSLLWDVARSLYSTALPEFVGARDARVRQLKKDGDLEAAQQVAAFEKPTAAADLVNQPVRHESGLPTSCRPSVLDCGQPRPTGTLPHFEP